MSEQERGCRKRPHLSPAIGPCTSNDGPVTANGNSASINDGPATKYVCSKTASSEPTTDDSTSAFLSSAPNSSETISDPPKPAFLGSTATSSATNEGSASATDGSVPAADGSVQAVDGSVLGTDGSALDTDGSAVATEGSALASAGSALATDGSVLVTDGSALATDKSALATDGSALATDGSALATDKSSLATDKSALATGGSALATDGSTTTTDGSATKSWTRRFATWQSVRLEKEFLYCNYLTLKRRAVLANEVRLTEEQVKNWFTRRRTKQKMEEEARNLTVRPPPVLLPTPNPAEFTATHFPPIDSNLWDQEGIRIQHWLQSGQQFPEFKKEELPSQQPFVLNYYRPIDQFQDEVPRQQLPLGRTVRRDRSRSPIPGHDTVPDPVPGPSRDSVPDPVPVPSHDTVPDPSHDPVPGLEIEIGAEDQGRAPHGVNEQRDLTHNLNVATRPGWNPEPK